MSRSGWAASLLLGTALWTAASLLSGGREPWDSGPYWTVFLPVAYAISGLLGFAFPERTWRWPLAVMLTQLPVMAISSGEIGGLWVLGIILLMVLALPGMLLAAIGRLLRENWAPE